MVFQLKPEMQVYRWSELNNYFVSGKSDCIAIGGGSNYSIWIEENFIHGCSNFCETFQSPCLASGKSFEVFKIEVWGFE